MQKLIDYFCGTPYKLSIFIPELMKYRKHLLLTRTEGNNIFTTAKGKTIKKESSLSSQLTTFFERRNLFTFLLKKDFNVNMKIVLTSDNAYSVVDLDLKNILFPEVYSSSEILVKISWMIERAVIDFIHW